jgi:thiamine-monophosphate kinase
VTRIGRITAEPGLTVVDAHGQAIPYDKTGYDHFAA